MATIAPNPLPLGAAASFVEKYSANGERVFVHTGSSAAHPIELTVKHKKLAKSSARPFEVLQVTISVAIPKDGATEGWVIDNISVSLTMPLVAIGAETYQARLRVMLTNALAYANAGFTDAELTSLNTILTDNVGDSLSLGMI